jgi:hypothetical protein
MKPSLTPEQAKTKNAYLLKNYHITLEFFDCLRAYQNYRCAMCKRVEADFKTNLAVDHCHRTGQLRGLLCWLCNKRLGKFSDDHELLRAAAEYVTFPTATACNNHKDVFTAPGRVGTKSRTKALAKLNGTSTKPKSTKRRSNGKSSRASKSSVKPKARRVRTAKS